MRLLTWAAYATLFIASFSIAHGDDKSMDIGMAMSKEMNTTFSAATPTASILQHAQSESPTSYFSYGQHSSTILAHIALMSIGWCFVLPAAVLLSIGRSRLAIPSQCLFLIFHSLGLLFGIIYNRQTPDLYENNAHHKIGWIATWVISAHVVLAWIFAHAGRGDAKQSFSTSFNEATFLPVSTGEQECAYQNGAPHGNGCYHDAGEGIEPTSPVSSPFLPSCESQAENYESETLGELHLKHSGLRDWSCSVIFNRLLLKVAPGRVSNRALRVLNGVYDIIDRIILPFGFIATATGAVTYGGIFHGNEIFNGLAHFIKGGILFWYGILTLGRFIGAWADLGWAWNKRPPAYVVGWKAKVPSGEFVESFFIWLYGVTNVFLEHLAGRRKRWSAADMEHVAISIMFFGGGLVGMLLESRRIRDVVNVTLLPTPAYKPDENWQPPRSQELPLNPMPALVILLLGMMMGSHHQESMTSTMVHRQWGNMLIGFAISRGMTYILLFLRPPTSYLPTRPPTEIVAGFCLMSGELIFMLSTRQVIEAMDFYELDPMFTLTVALGFTAFIMSLVVLNLTIKAWAVKRERAQE